MESEPRSLDPEKLIAHSAFIRSIAAAILRDRDDADDVVQDTWVQASAGAPRSGWRFESWLAGIAGNLARALKRTRTRRMRREAARASSEAVPSTLETVVRLETFRSVVDSVQELEEPYRRVVIMRHFDGLPLREIARRLDVPVETIHTRLRRAHDQLRGRLDARHEGRREGWSLALLPLIDPQPLAGAVAGGSTAFLFGALLMKLKVIVAAAAALLVATLTILWATGAIGAPPAALTNTGELAPATASGGATANADAELAATAGERRTLSQPAQPPTLVVRGRTVEGSQPLPRARLRARALRGVSEDEVLAEGSVVANGLGEFTWEVRVPEAESLSLRFEGAEPDLLAIPTRLFVAPGERSTDPCEVRFYRFDCDVSGHVTDESGAPIQDASVRSFLAGATTTDATGAFTLRRSSDSWIPGYYVASAAGFARATASIPSVGPGNHATLDFRLRREATLSGSVRDESGQPIAGARVTAFDQASGVRTDAQGAFELRELDPGAGTQPVSADRQGFLPGGIRVQLAAGPCTVVLKRGVQVAGVVLDPAGAPQAGAGIFVEGQGPLHGAVPAALSGPDGSFGVPCLASGKQTLLAFRRGVGIVTATIDVPGDKEGLAGVRLQLEAPHFLAGRVVDSDGKALAGVSIGFAANGANREILLASTTTAVDGSFRAEGLLAGTVGVSVQKNGFFADTYQNKPGRVPMSRNDLKQIPVDRDDVLLTMQKAGGLAGRVLDAATGQPVPAFRVRFLQAVLRPQEQQPPGAPGYSHDWHGQGQWFSGTGGTWSTAGDNLRPGWVHGIEITAPGRVPWTDAHVVVTTEPEANAIIARLEVASSLSGRVLSAGGEAAPGVTVTVFTKANPLQPLNPADVHAHPLSVTDGAGGFRFDAVPAGEISLAAKPPDGPIVIDGPFQVPPGGGAIERTVRLHSGGSVSGVVVDESGQAVAGALVSLEAGEVPGARELQVRTTADSAGRFAFTRVASGNYSVVHTVERGGKSALAVSVGVSVLAPEPREVRLQPGTGTAELQIDRKVAAGMPKLVAVRLTPLEWAQSSKVPWEARTPVRGGFVEEGKPLLIRQLRAGEYFLTANEPFWLQRIVILEGQTNSATMPR